MCLFTGPEASEREGEEEVGAAHLARHGDDEVIYRFPLSAAFTVLEVCPGTVASGFGSFWGRFFIGNVGGSWVWLSGSS